MKNFGSFPVAPLISLLELIEKKLELAAVKMAADQENCLPHQHVPDLLWLKKRNLSILMKVRKCNFYPLVISI